MGSGVGAEREGARVGVLERWNDERGFGFIRPDDGGQKVFVHISGFARVNGRPETGDRVDFLVEPMPDGRTKAVQVHDLDKPFVVARGSASAVAIVAIVAFAVLYFVVDGLWGPLPWGVAALYLGMSVLGFVLYASDKKAAREGAWRVRESSLILVGLVGGWPGAILAQQFLRHKTRKAGFQIAFWMTTLLNIAGFVAVASPLFPAELRPW